MLSWVCWLCCISDIALILVTFQNIQEKVLRNCEKYGSEAQTLSSDFFLHILKSYEDIVQYLLKISKCSKNKNALSLRFNLPKNEIVKNLSNSLINFPRYIYILKPGKHIGSPSPLILIISSSSPDFKLSLMTSKQISCKLSFLLSARIYTIGLRSPRLVMWMN